MTIIYLIQMQTKGTLVNETSTACHGVNTYTIWRADNTVNICYVLTNL